MKVPQGKISSKWKFNKGLWRKKQGGKWDKEV